MFIVMKTKEEQVIKGLLCIQVVCQHIFFSRLPLSCPENFVQVIVKNSCGYAGKIVHFRRYFKLHCISRYMTFCFKLMRCSRNNESSVCVAFHDDMILACVMAKVVSQC